MQFLSLLFSVMLVFAMAMLDLAIYGGIALAGVLLTAGVLAPKIKAIVAEVKDALEKLNQARQVGSPDGVDLSDSEQAQLWKEAVDILQEIYNQYGGGFMARLFGR